MENFKAIMTNREMYVDELMTYFDYMVLEKMYVGGAVLVEQLRSEFKVVTSIYVKGKLLRDRKRVINNLEVVSSAMKFIVNKHDFCLN